MLKSILNRQGAAQGSKEWLYQRKKLITATDVPTIIGLNPYSSADELLEKKKSQDSVPISSEATQWGNFFEEVAAQCYQKKHNPLVTLIQPNLIHHPREEYLGASPDRIILPEGILPDGGLPDGGLPEGKLSLLEVKCPYRRSLSPEPAKMYLAQVQHQLEVCDLDLGYLWECSIGVTTKDAYNASSYKYKGIINRGLTPDTDVTYWYLKESRLTEVLRDRTWFQQVVLPQCKNFYRQLTSRKRKKRTPTEDSSIEDYSTFIRPHQLINYLRQDALLDWLNEYGEKAGFQKDPTDEFLSLLRHQQWKLRSTLRDTFPGSVYKCHDVASTAEAIRLRYPVIENATMVIPEKKMIVTVPFLLYHKDVRSYQVVEVKFRRLNILKDNHYLSMMKAQLPVQLNAYWATQGLQRLQRTTPLEPIVYGNNTHAHVNLEKLELKYKTKWEDALEWRHRFKKHGKKMKPNTDMYMMPNMCNTADSPWHRVKSKLATDRGDLTQIWQCRPKHRAKALQDGIESTFDDNCTAENIGFDNLTSKTKLAPTVDALLKQSRSHQPTTPLDWKGILDHQPRDCYLDLEFAGNKLLGGDTSNMIYLIGFGYMRKNQWKKHQMVAKDMSMKSERKILLEYKRWVQRQKLPPRFFHWSAAEPTQFKKAFERHAIKPPKVEYIDLMRVFINNPLTVKGCVNYKLKNITKALSNEKLIKQSYDDSECANGADSMIMCWKHYGIYGSNIDYEVDFMELIKKYNEIDCQVLQEIHALF